MKRAFQAIFIILFFMVNLSILSCSDSLIIDEPEREFYYPEEEPIIGTDSLGRANAVKKARQLTDIIYTPLNPIPGRTGNYEAGVLREGVIYSSARELEQFVGIDISFHTFMTAIHNPKSKLYTEDISQYPYHGTNCKAYYGTVCSSLVSYALGLTPRYYANDFPISEMMDFVPADNINLLKIADVLWRDGHVAIITDIITDPSGLVQKVEISESIGQGCRRYYRTAESFQKLMQSSFKYILRYKELYKNTSYTPVPEFVAVGDEIPTLFTYNNDLCVDKGDRSCYREDETVIICTFHPYDYMEIYKDGRLLRQEGGGHDDVVINALAYGDYMARVFSNGMFSEYTYWKVVNMNVQIDKKKKRVYFNSSNAIPHCIKFCDITGSGGSPMTNSLRMLTKEDKRRGYIDVAAKEISRDYPYIRVNFETNYGRIINRPINWYD